eukprot:scaffold81997_cov21-Prasinocladus_malaysianus.AAC.1
MRLSAVGFTMFTICSSCQNLFTINPDLLIADAVTASIQTVGSCCISLISLTIVDSYIRPAAE